MCGGNLIFLILFTVDYCSCVRQTRQWFSVSRLLRVAHAVSSGVIKCPSSVSLDAPSRSFPHGMVRRDKWGVVEPFFPLFSLFHPKLYGNPEGLWLFHS